MSKKFLESVATLVKQKAAIMEDYYNYGITIPEVDDEVFKYVALALLNNTHDLGKTQFTFVMNNFGYTFDYWLESLRTAKGEKDITIYFKQMETDMTLAVKLKAWRDHDYNDVQVAVLLQSKDIHRITSGR